MKQRILAHRRMLVYLLLFFACICLAFFAPSLSLRAVEGSLLGERWMQDGIERAPLEEVTLLQKLALTSADHVTLSDGRLLNAEQAYSRSLSSFSAYTSAAGIDFDYTRILQRSMQARLYVSGNLSCVIWKLTLTDSSGRKLQGLMDEESARLLSLSCTVAPQDKAGHASLAERFDRLLSEHAARLSLRVHSVDEEQLRDGAEYVIDLADADGILLKMRLDTEGFEISVLKGD